MASHNMYRPIKRRRYRDITRHLTVHLCLIVMFNIRHSTGLTIPLFFHLHSYAQRF